MYTRLIRSRFADAGNSTELHEGTRIGISNLAPSLTGTRRDKLDGGKATLDPDWDIGTSGHVRERIRLPRRKETETRLNSTRVCFTVVITEASFTRQKYQHAFTSMPKDVTGIRNRCLSHTRFAFNYRVSDNRRNCWLPAALHATVFLYLSVFGDR